VEVEALPWWVYAYDSTWEMAVGEKFQVDGKVYECATTTDNTNGYGNKGCVEMLGLALYTQAKDSCPDPCFGDETDPFIAECYF